MGTNIYIRKIPKAERKKELMELIAKLYQQRLVKSGAKYMVIEKPKK